MTTTPSRHRPRLDANALAGLARRVPVPAVRAGMASPGGALVVDQIMRMMPSRLRSGQPVDAVARWDIRTGAKRTRTWFLVFSGKSCKATRRDPGTDPRVTFGMTANQLLRLATGQTDGIATFMSGEIKITGDLLFAQQLSMMFEIPKP